MLDAFFQLSRLIASITGDLFREEKQKTTTTTATIITADVTRQHIRRNNNTKKYLIESCNFICSCLTWPSSEPSVAAATSSERLSFSLSPCDIFSGSESWSTGVEFTWRSSHFTLTTRKSFPLPLSDCACARRCFSAASSLHQSSAKHMHNTWSVWTWLFLFFKASLAPALDSNGSRKVETSRQAGRKGGRKARRKGKR